MAQWVSQIMINNQSGRVLHLSDAKISLGEKEIDDGKFPSNIEPGETGIYEVYSPAGRPSGIEFYLSFYDIAPTGQAQYGTMDISVDIPFWKHANNGSCVTSGNLFTTGFGRIPNGVHNFDTTVIVYGPDAPKAVIHKVHLASQDSLEQLYPEAMVLDYLLVDYTCQADGNTYVLGIYHNGQVINRVRLNPERQQYKHAVQDCGEYEVYIEKEWKQKDDGIRIVVPNRDPRISVIGRLNLLIDTYPNDIDISDLKIKQEDIISLDKLQDICGGFFAVKEMQLEQDAAGYVSRIHFLYYMDSFTFQRVQKKVRNIANSISGDSNVLTDFEKAVQLFNWFAYNSNYEAKDGHDAYAFFQDHKATCDGVAQAFELTAKHLGLNVLKIGTSEISHAWNMIEVDGQWYHADAFWAHHVDLLSQHFLKSDAVFQQTHSKSHTICWGGYGAPAPKSGNFYDHLDDMQFKEIVERHEEVPFFGYLNVDKEKCTLGESISLTTGIACISTRNYEETYNRDYQLQIRYTNEQSEEITCIELVKYDVVHTFTPPCAATYHLLVTHWIGEANITTNAVDVVVEPAQSCILKN